ncbi:MAG TPA: hypothetical protein VFU07_07855 [Candidatus Lumbricidophila sp.]|nr:hypothetical protein [Candidatus Lumbricidophila sp.]
MTLKDEITTYANKTFGTSWTVTDGRKVPTADSSLGLGNEAVRLDAVVLYADLADSTGLVRDKKWEFASEVYKTFVYTAAKCIRYRGGEVTAYDGDRVMGVFIGEGKESAAVRAGFELKGMVETAVMPELKKVWSGDFQLRHKVGIDASEVRVANTGIRGNTDYVWVGNAANNAAKMAALSSDYATYVTKAVFSKLDRGLTHSDSGYEFFHRASYTGLTYDVYGSNAVIKY